MSDPEGVAREPTWISVAALVVAHAESIATFGGAPGLRDPGLLDSALARPRNLHAYGEIDLAALAAAYAFGVVRNHPFIDGNKRAAFLACAVFLEINGLRLVAGEADAATQVWALADGDLAEVAFAAWLRANTVTNHPL